jgi:hypothetical protein
MTDLEASHKDPEKFSVPGQICHDYGQAKNENSKTPTTCVDNKGTGQKKTQENRQSCKQSPEQMVEVNGIRVFP